jgi:hypothetical protein
MREIICADAIEWLQTAEVEPHTALLGSLPDISEFPGFTLKEWSKWFQETAELIIQKTPQLGVSLFFQSDIKLDGRWVDKAYLCQKAAEAQGSHLLWHKIVCRSPVGIATFGRPAYSHILCFSKELRLDPAKSLPDVLPDVGEKTWNRGMGFKASKMIAQFLLKETQTKKVINPFCGEGGFLSICEREGFETLGIERSPKRAEKARQIQVNSEGTNWL